MLKELWGKVAYYTFLGLLLIFGFLFGKLNFRAESIGIYAPMNGYNGVDGCSANGKFNYDTLGANVQGNVYWSIGNINTAISGKAKNFYIAFKHDLEAQKTYDVTINFHSNDVRNKLKSSMVVLTDGDSCGDMQGSHISLVSFKNSATSSNNTNKIKLRIYSPSLIGNWGIMFLGSNTELTSVSNFGINSVDLVAVDTTGTSDIINNQNNNTNTMIDNNNENTTNIINNQSQNTTDIINNQNQNAQDIINNQNQQSNNEISSQNVCRALKYGSSCGYLGQQGQLQTQDCNTSNNRTSDYTEVNSQSSITLYKQASNNGSWRLCFYDSSKTNISCVFNGNYNEGDNIPIPTNTKYIRYTTNITSGQRYHLCSNGNQALNDSVNDLNDSINSDDVDNPSSFISDMEDLLPTNGTITQLIGLPITLYTKVLNSINGTCQRFNLGSLYGTNLIIPCIDVNTYLGNTLWNTIDIIISGAFVLVIARKMIKAFENFTSMKDGDVIND